MSRGTTLDRRRFLQVSVSALGGLIIASKPALASISSPIDAPNGALGDFVRIEPDGRVLLGARGCEIGQGVMTSLPMLIAEELDVSWESVSVEQLPYEYLADDGEGRSRYGAQGAGGSTSIPDSWLELRQIGAVARQLLMDEAAERWRVSRDVLRTAAGVVIHPNGERLAYGGLVNGASKRLAPTAIVLKPLSSFRIIGKPARVVDAQAIVRGEPLYGLDQRLPGAKVAVLLRSPIADAELASVDMEAAKAVAGVFGVYPIDGPKADEPYSANLRAAVAIVADDTWAAIKARRLLEPKWKRSRWSKESSKSLRAKAEKALTAKDAEVVQEQGDFSAVAKAAETVFRRDYEQPFLAHATLEPQNALIRIDDESAELIAPLQSPAGASRMIHALTDIPRERIKIRMTRSGGGFGRRLSNDFVAEAVRVALAAKVPIRLIWTREDDFAADFYRPYGMHRIEAAVDVDKNIVGWRHRVAATPKITRDPGMAGAPNWVATHEKDEFPAHLVPAWRHEFVALESGLGRGWWRGPLPTFIAFPVQSFVDELAAELELDPLKLRHQMLGSPRDLPYSGHGGPIWNTGRLRRVMDLAAEKIAWQRRSKLPAGHGLGIAAHFVFGGYAAHAVEVSVSDRGELKVLRCVAVADIGRVVNPLGAQAQIMGATIDGLSTALALQITLDQGRVQQQNFPDYPLLRMADAPDVEVHLIDSQADPGGAGEMGIATIAPALTNAIYAATGKRIRSLPIADQLRDAADDSA